VQQPVAIPPGAAARGHTTILIMLLFFSLFIILFLLFLLFFSLVLFLKEVALGRISGYIYKLHAGNMKQAQMRDDGHNINVFLIIII
jgi:hypothetical protein